MTGGWVGIGGWGRVLLRVLGMWSRNQNCLGSERDRPGQPREEKESGGVGWL